MKIRLTPELSYIIGFWKTLRTKEGIGIKGKQQALDLFVKLCLEQKLTESNKFQMKKNEVYFYHTKYRKFFFKIVESELEKFKYINDYSGSFVAGLFDASGGITEKGIVYLSGLSRTDEILLMRLDFLTDRKKDKVIIMKPRIFLRFVKPYLKLKKIPDELTDVKKKRKRVVYKENL